MKIPPTPMRHPALWCPPILLVLLAACSPTQPDSASTTGLSADEAARLEAAAARLDARAPSPAQADAVALERTVRAGIEAETPANPPR